MQIDRRTLDGLLKLNDKQLMAIINRLATESGIDPAAFNIDPKSVSSIRSALSGATDEQLNEIVEQYNRSKAGNAKRGSTR